MASCCMPWPAAACRAPSNPEPGPPASSRWPGIPHISRQQQDARPDVGHQPPQAARGRRRLTALVAAAVLGTSMLLAAVTQRQAGHAPQADPRPASAISFGQVALSRARLVHRGRHPGGRPGPRHHDPRRSATSSAASPSSWPPATCWAEGLDWCRSSPPGPLPGLPGRRAQHVWYWKASSSAAAYSPRRAAKASGREPVATSHSRYTSSAEIEGFSLTPGMPL